MASWGRLHQGSALGGPDVFLRSLPVQQPSRLSATSVAHQATCVFRERLVSSRAAGSGAAIQPAATATAAAAVAPSATTLQPEAAVSSERQQQQQQPPPQAADAASSSPPQGVQQQQAGAGPAQYSSSSAAASAGADAPVALTAAIAASRSLPQLQELLQRHSSSMNHIHISAAFVQLQRLWTSSSSSSSSNNCTSSNAAAAAAAASSAVGSAILLQLQGLAQGLSRVDARYCANVLYSLALLEPLQPAAYCPALVEQICAAAHELANVMPPQELATIVWSLAQLDVLPAPQLVRRLIANILRRLPAFSAQDLAMVLTGLPRLSVETGRVSPYSTVHRLAAAAHDALAAASPQEAVLLLAALARLQYKPSGAWLSSFWEATGYRLSQLAAPEIGMAGWALGQLAPLAAPPPISWLAAWEESVAAACLGSGSSQQQQQQQSGQQQDSSSSSSWGRQGAAAGTRGASEPSRQEVDSAAAGSIALVELSQAVYGWSKAAPLQPPSDAFLARVYSSTHQAMAAAAAGSAGSSSGRCGSLMLKQLQQQQHRQLRRLQRSEQQLQQLEGDSSSSNSSGVSVSAQLLVELLSAAARWQQLPPRPWLLAALSSLQLQLSGPQSCSSWQLSSLLWALAILRVKPNPAWLKAATAALQRQLQQQRLAWQQQQERRVEGAAWAQHQGQQQAAVVKPKQMAVALWSFKQLQHRPGPQFWRSFWPASLPLLSSGGGFQLADIVMTLEAAEQLEARPPRPWLNAALKAGVARTSLLQRQQAAAAAVTGTAAARQRSGAKDSQQQQQPRGEQQAAVDLGGVEPSSSSSSRSQHLPDLVRLAAAAARHGAVPGHTWCCRLLELLAATTALGGTGSSNSNSSSALAAQAVSRLLWSLAKLGYRPPGGVLPDWLLAALTQPDSSSSGSSSRPGSQAGSTEAAAAATGAGAGAAARVLAGYSQEQLQLLLLGLRGCGIVPGAAWLLGLLQFSAVAAAGWRLEVLVALLRYVAAARIRPLDSWKQPISRALTTSLQQQQWQQQQWQQQQGQQPGLQWVPGLIRALLQLRFVPDADLAQQLSQLAAAAAPQLQPEHAELQAACLARLMRLQQQPESLQQQEQQQRQRGPCMQADEQKLYSRMQPSAARQGQQQHTQLPEPHLPWLQQQQQPSGGDDASGLQQPRRAESRAEDASTSSSSGSGWSGAEVWTAGSSDVPPRPGSTCHNIGAQQQYKGRPNGVTVGAAAAASCAAQAASLGASGLSLDGDES